MLYKILIYIFFNDCLMILHENRITFFKFIKINIFYEVIKMSKWVEKTQLQNIKNPVFKTHMTFINKKSYLIILLVIYFIFYYIKRLCSAISVPVSFI